MRTSTGILIAGLFILALGSPGLARTETITGEVIDLACYARNKVTGMHHDRALECAWACVRWEGQPVGLLAADGKVYQLAGGLVANSNAKIAPHLTHKISVTGEVTEIDGMLTLTSNDLTMVK